MSDNMKFSDWDDDDWDDDDDDEEEIINDENAKYPNIIVQLTGQDGNAFSILGRVMKAMERNGVPEEEINEYLKEAKSEDYVHLLTVTAEWVTIK